MQMTWKAWDWSRGKKSIAALVLLLVAFGPEILAAVGNVISAAGGDPMRFLKVGAAVLGLVGLLDKAYRALPNGEGK